jgi:DNA-binding NarL/FixJ family response regulator
MNPWHLTERQCEVLASLADGRTSKEASRALGCAPKTVEQHVFTAKLRMGAETRTQAVVMYDRHVRGSGDGNL